MKLLNKIVVAALCLARLVASQQCAKKDTTCCYSKPDCPCDVCWDSVAGKCVQLSQPKDYALYYNKYCWEQMPDLWAVDGACWELRPNWYYSCGYCWAKKGTEALRNCPNCPTPSFRDPKTGKCYKLEDKKTGAKYYGGRCLEKSTLPNLLAKDQVCWQRRDPWYWCGMCYAVKKYCTGC
jgi:hypothetical protein